MTPTFLGNLSSYIGWLQRAVFGGADTPRIPSEEPCSTCGRYMDAIGIEFETLKKNTRSFRVEFGCVKCQKTVDGGAEFDVKYMAIPKFTIPVDAGTVETLRLAEVAKRPTKVPLIGVCTSCQASGGLRASAVEGWEEVIDGRVHWFFGVFVHCEQCTFAARSGSMFEIGEQ